jgi:hypothetical protein
VTNQWSPRQQLHRTEEPRVARLIRWDPADGNPSLVGRATIAFSGGWIVNSIPVFRRTDGSLSAGPPSIPIVGTDGVHQRDADSGKKRYAAVITFADADAKRRWDRTVVTALADAGIGGAP